ncbi:MAG: PAAR-like domain-containing protein [Polyangiaceae bacterium]
MGNTTSNQDRVVATKGTPHIAKTCGATDVGMDPCTGATAPFPNEVPTALLTPGTSTTFIADQPIWTEPHQVGPPSGPSKAPFVIGVCSGTHIAEARATSYSSDVFAEGSGLVRTDDTTTQNHANTSGFVDGSALAGMPAATVGFLQGQCTIVELTGVNEGEAEAPEGFSVGPGTGAARNLGYPGAPEDGVPPYYLEILSSTEVKFKAVRKDMTKPAPENPTCWKKSSHTRWEAKRTGEGASEADPVEGVDEYTLTSALTALMFGNDDRWYTNNTSGLPGRTEDEHMPTKHQKFEGNENLSVKSINQNSVKGTINSLEAVFAYFLYWAMPVNVNVKAISCGGSRNAQIRIFPKQKVAVEVNFADKVETDLRTTRPRGHSGARAMREAMNAINKLRGIEWMVKKFAELSKKNVAVEFCSNMTVSFEVCFKPCTETKRGYLGIKNYTPAHVGMPWKVALNTPVLIGIELEFEISLINLIAPGIGEGAATALRRLGVKADLVFQCSLTVPLTVSIGADEYGFLTNTGVEVALKPMIAIFVRIGTGINLITFGAQFPGSLSAAFTGSDKPKVLMQLQPKGELKTIFFLTIFEDSWFENTWEKEWEAVRINWVGPKYDLFKQS